MCHILFTCEGDICGREEDGPNTWHKENGACAALREAPFALDLMFSQSVKCPITYTSSPLPVCVLCSMLFNKKPLEKERGSELSSSEGRKEGS